jgi:hypothetical protein
MRSGGKSAQPRLVQATLASRDPIPSSLADQHAKSVAPPPEMRHHPCRRWVASMRSSAARASRSLYSAIGDRPLQLPSRSTLQVVL